MVFSKSLDKTQALERERREGTNFANFQAFFESFADLRNILSRDEGRVEKNLDFEKTVGESTDRIRCEQMPSV